MNIAHNCAYAGLILAAALAAGSTGVEIQSSNVVAVASKSDRAARSPEQCAHDCNSRQSTDGDRLPGPPSTTWGLIQSYQQRNALRGGRVPIPEISCRIDPRTGCHYGHREESHPGGCHCNSY